MTTSSTRREAPFVDDEVSTGSKGRRRGGPLRIDRARIIEVAKSLDPQTLTMKAVADEMGVDRKALNYHVTDREGLLRLVAADVYYSHFTDAFSRALEQSSGPDDWRHGARAWAVAVRDSIVATNILSFDNRIAGDNSAIFEPIELVLQRMLTAGFDITTASRTVILLTRLGMGVGRDIVTQRMTGSRPQEAEVRDLLASDADANQFTAFRKLIEADFNGLADIEEQFEFEVDLVLDGMERRLTPRRAGATRRS